MARIRKSETGTKSGYWKAALYIRLSKDDGNVESLSVTNQRKRLLEHIDKLREEECSVDNEMIIHDIYIDDGLTGTDDCRDGFQRMISDIDNGYVNMVCVKDLSRFSRDVADTSYYIQRYFIRYDVRFVSLELQAVDSYRNPASMSSIMVSIQSVFNENYAAETSLKVRATFDAKRRRGEFIGGWAPYGYERNPENPSSLVIDDEAAAVVRDIYSWYVNDGFSKLGITSHLNQLGIPSPSLYKKIKGYTYANVNSKGDGLWSYQTISIILKNKVYLGHMVQGRERVKSYKVHDRVRVPEEDWFIVENTHEPIIDKSLYDKAQLLQTRDMRTANNKSNVYLFSGFLKCADCGRSLQRTTAKGVAYYACRTYRERSKEKCTKHSIRESLLTNIVLEVIKTQIAVIENIQKEVEQINLSPVIKTQSVRLEQLLKSKEDEVEQLIKLKRMLYIDWKNGDISREEHNSMKHEFDSRIEQLTITIQKVKEECRAMNNGVGADDPYLASFLKYMNIQSLERGIVVALIKAILIHENGGVTVKFNCDDQYQRIVDFVESNRYDSELLENLA